MTEAGRNFLFGVFVQCNREKSMTVKRIATEADFSRTN